MQGRNQWPAGKVLIVTIIISVVAGALAGYGLGYTFQYQGPTTRVYFLFNSSVDLNESLYPYIHDTFFPDHLTANRGDTIVVHYINTEPPQGGEHHSFTMDQPYGPGLNATSPSTGIIVDPGRYANITFTVNLPGIFRYYCIFHQPTMTGYLTVLG